MLRQQVPAASQRKDAIQADLQLSLHRGNLPLSFVWEVNAEVFGHIQQHLKTQIHADTEKGRLLPLSNLISLKGHCTSVKHKWVKWSYQHPIFLTVQHQPESSQIKQFPDHNSKNTSAGLQWGWRLLPWARTSLRCWRESLTVGH